MNCLFREQRLFFRLLDIKLLKHYSTNKPYFVTTPIFYVNAEPHVGHLYTLLVADAMKRFQTMITGKQVLLSTGTDEHGLKVIQRVAESHSLKPIELCDKTSVKFKELCSAFYISNDDFMRTSEQRHKDAVTEFWNKIYRNGFIYKDSYKGWYCSVDEAFVTELNVTEVERDGKIIKVSLESGNPVEWFEEDNYKFALSAFQEKLLKWVLSDPEIVKPNIFYNNLLDELNHGLTDVSVSRPKSRVYWGIDVPGDDTQTIYVWFDALVNYLTFLGYPDNCSIWPPDCQIIGKDILKFHAIYWPAFLMAADMQLPKRIICHSHWLVEDLKMSKSRGNVINPFTVMDKCTSEGLRYYLLRQGVPHSDTSFSEVQLPRYLNAELADNYGNLLSRCLTKTINKQQVYPSTPCVDFFSNGDFKELITSLDSLSDLCKEHYSNANFYLGIEAIMSHLRKSNDFVQKHEPWKLVKCNDKLEKLNAVIYCVCETLRVCSLLLQPIIPVLSNKVLSKLSIPEEERDWKYTKPCFSSESKREPRNLSEEKFIV
ncbi:methionyl-tRNA synthetase-like protein, partial [Leptotrombidium deliense]